MVSTVTASRLGPPEPRRTRSGQGGGENGQQKHVESAIATMAIVIAFSPPPNPSQTLRSPSKLVGHGDTLAQVDARYPAILFKQQLTACVEKIFGQLRDNLKKEISPLLSVCIQLVLQCILSWREDVLQVVTMTQDQIGSSSCDDDSSRGSPPRRAGPQLKKVPWTPSEDAVLEAYVKKHGEGNWNAMQKNTTLLRCGRST